MYIIISRHLTLVYIMSKKRDLVYRGTCYNSNQICYKNSNYINKYSINVQYTA